MSLAVAALFDIGGPTAVVFAVSAIIVDAVNAEQSALAVHSWRPWSHIGEKSSERSAPARADGDAASAVSMIAWIGGIVATLKH